MDEMKLKGIFTEANLEFQGKILERSGLGDETGLSDGIAAMKDGEVKTSLRAALDESEMILYDVVEQLINKTGIDPQEVCCIPVHSKRRIDSLPYKSCPASPSNHVLQTLHAAALQRSCESGSCSLPACMHC